jgi:hypothetical protein
MRSLLFLIALSVPALAAGPMQFWNLTGATINDLRLAPSGSDKFGPNQCANDPDGSVDSDERLRLTGVTPGKYDVRMKWKSGRMCTVHGVNVSGQGKYAFSLDQKDLKGCPSP